MTSHSGTVEDERLRDERLRDCLEQIPRNLDGSPRAGWVARIDAPTADALIRELLERRAPSRPVEAGELVERLQGPLPNKVVGVTPISGIREVEFDWGKIEAERHEAASSLTSLQARVEELERDLEAEADHRQRLQGALMFWMPGVRPETDEGLERSAGDDAYLLAGFNGPDPETCWGDDTLARLQEAEKALEPFAEAADQLVRDGTWSGERMVDWLGPSDFRRARSTLKGEA